MNKKISYDHNLGFTEILKSLVFKGLKEKEVAVTDIVLDRINYELSIIESCNFQTYFITYAKLIEVCNEQNVLRSCGRGSAAGSLVNYCLDITKISPIKESLIFERFILPKITQMPDIDIDIPKDKTQLIIDKFKEKYPEYFSYYIATQKTNDENVTNVFHDDIWYNKHPSGIILSKVRLNGNVFNYHGKEYYLTNHISNDQIYDSKIDLVELEYLNKLQLIVNAIGDKFHPYKLPLNDTEVFKYFANGDLGYIFQFNTPILKKIIQDFQPQSISELAILNAMYRPGLVEHIPKLIENKFGRENTYRYTDSRLNNILEETYGILIYQETFLLICNEIAGMTFSEAEVWKRRIFRDKTNNEQLAFIKYFREACENNSSLQAVEVSRLITVITNTVSMTFIKAHSLSYAIVGYWGAFYKTYFTKEFEKFFDITSDYQNFGFLK